MTLRPSPNFPMPTPGEMIAELIENMGVTKTALAGKLGVTRKALYDVLDGSSAISPKMAIALEREVGSTAEFWLRVQAGYDLWMERKKSAAPQRKIGSKRRAAG